MKKLRFMFFSSIVLFPAISFSQIAVLRNAIADKLQIRLTKFIAEKAYLQFDKPFYAAGDTIYFKAYVTKGENHQLSDLSGVLRVDLINAEGRIDQSIKLQLDTGITWGDFALPDSLPAGNYRVRAYTQWMRNEGENDFFEKTMAIGAVKPAKIPESLVKQPALNLKPDIQFLPEGGNLITDINTKVAFKATGPNGLGIEVKGIVVENDNKQVASFASTHLGMGSFTFTPSERDTYSVKITWPNRAPDIINLPKALKEGITMSVNNESLAKATVNIKTNPVFFAHNKGKAYTLLIYSGGQIATVDCQLDSPQIKLDILKRKLHTGIATVTLFSSTNEPLCERLFFVQNYDRLNIDVSSNKSAYSPREKVNVKIGARNRKGETAEGHFSVAVINEATVPESDVNADNILSYLLLTSDLKGCVQQPDYYFADTSAVARENLDNLMLTQGYRKFEWKQVLDTEKHTLTYQPEQSLTIAGRVDNLSNKPVASGMINLIPSKGGRMLTALTDSKGLFRFTNLSFIDTAHFVLSAVNNKGKNTTKITYFNEKKESIYPLINKLQSLLQQNDTIPGIYVMNDKIQQQELTNYISHKAIMLKQVNIHYKKPDNQYRTQSLAGAGNADQILHADEIGRISGPLTTSLNGRLHGIVFQGRDFQKQPYLVGLGSGPMYVIIDGQEGADINSLNAEDVETVEVLKYSTTSIYGSAGGNGVLVITTKQTRQLDPRDIASIGVLPISVMGFYKARDFYSPKYDNPAALNSKQRDLRSTIYWNPEIQTDKDGNASFDYYNADGTGTYKVTIEGIDKDGNIGRQVYRYEVK